jgi:CRISPR-associated protein Cmr4
MSTIYNYKAAFFSITTKTPMHCGAGGENFWIIDKLIQRDETTNLPNINSSSLKGALREYMKDYLSNSKKINGLSWATVLFQIFGNDNTDLSTSDKDIVAKDLNVPVNKLEIAGDLRILPAELLSIPTLKEGKIKHIISCEWLKQNLYEKIELFDHKLSDRVTLETIIQSNEYIDEIEFCEKVDDYNLPVIARNHLEDGTSTNLWYEQVLPRETKLFFTVVYNNEELFKIFKDSVITHPIQIGANASVGYGFCKIEEIPTTIKNCES